MYPFILCSCGNSIGDLYELFQAMKFDKQQAYFEAHAIDVDPAILPIVDDIDISVGDILDQLNIRLECCRVKIMTQVMFKDMMLEKKN